MANSASSAERLLAEKLAGGKAANVTAVSAGIPPAPQKGTAPTNSADQLLAQKLQGASPAQAEGKKGVLSKVWSAAHAPSRAIEEGITSIPKTFPNIPPEATGMTAAVLGEAAHPENVLMSLFGGPIAKGAIKAGGAGVKFLLGTSTAKKGAMKMSKAIEAVLAEKMRPLPTTINGWRKFREGRLFTPEVKEELKTVVENVSKIKNPLPTALNAMRPVDATMAGLGLGPLHKVLRRATQSFSDDVLRLGDRVTEIAKKYGIKEGTKEDRLLFDVLDGKLSVKKASKQIAGASAELKKVYLDLAEEYGIPKYRRIADYMWHMSKKGSWTGEEKSILDAVLFGDRVAKKIKLPGFMKRRANVPFEYVRSAISTTRAYVMNGSKYSNFRPVLKLMDDLGKKLSGKNDRAVEYMELLGQKIIGKSGPTANLTGDAIKWAAKGTDSVADLLPAGSGVRKWVKNKMGTIMEAPTGKLGEHFWAKVRGTGFKGVLGLSPSAAVQNSMQTVNTFAELGEKYVKLGYADMAKAIADPRWREILKKSGVISEGAWKKVMMLEEGAKEGVSDLTMILFQGAENKNRIVSFFAGMRKALDQTVAAEANPKLAFEYGKHISGKTQFLWDISSTPLAFQSTGGKIMFQLGSYGIRQTEFLSPIAAAKDVGRGVKKILQGKGKEAVKNLTSSNVARMLRYIIGTEYMIQAGRLADVDLRPMLRPVYWSEEKKRLLPGFFMWPLGLIPSAAFSASEAWRGVPGKARQTALAAANFVPGGREMVTRWPRVAAEYKKTGKIPWRTAVGLRRFPKETIPSKAIKFLWGEGE